MRVFNLDPKPLVFVNDPESDEWPARIEGGARVYCFKAMGIAELPEPVSQQDKGKRVEANRVQLPDLWAGSME
jgi:hypothetical protein